jgi:Tol biopolymer transport system component
LFTFNDSVLTVRQIRDGAASPDNKRLAFTALDVLYVGDLTAARGGVGAQKIAIGNPRRLTPGGMVEHSPSWSPDGRYIAYVTWTAAQHSSRRGRRHGPARATHPRDRVL